MSKSKNSGNGVGPPESGSAAYQLGHRPRLPEAVSSSLLGGCLPHNVVVKLKQVNTSVRQVGSTE